MSARKVQERAVDRMVQLLKSEPIGALRWNDIERKLMGRIAQSGLPASSMPEPVASRRFARSVLVADVRRQSLRPLGRAAQLAAVAAAIVLAIGAGARSGPAASGAAPAARWVDIATIALLPPSATDAAGGDRDLGALRPGDGIDAQPAPVSLARPGAVRFTLVAGSRAIVKASGASDVVTLERGSIRIEVTPRDPASGFVEAFAVEVDQTRVAAHGTVFSVERRADGVVVQVEHGTVAVGPVGRNAITTGHLLVGPKRALFSPDGARSARLLPPVEPAPGALLHASRVVDPAGEPRVMAPGGAGPALVANPAKPPAVAEREQAAPAVPHAPVWQTPKPVHAPPIEAPAAVVADAVPPAPRVLTHAAVLADVRRCFTTLHRPADSSVRVSVASTLTLTAQPDGHLAAARFQPPLEGAFQSCVWAAVKDGRLAGNAPSMSIPFVLSP